MIDNSHEFLSDEEVEEQNIKLACGYHFSALSRNFRKRVKRDDYGTIISDERPAEAEKFFTGLGLSVRAIGDVRAIKLVLAEVARLESKSGDTLFQSSDAPIDGHDFEHWVAQKLRKFGWQASATKGSGDQGIDVVATKGDVALGIQCKRYSGSVGNKAVQEAFSGAKHMGLNNAAVLSNADFTKSAKELAASTGVLLLSPEDIPALSERTDLV